MAVARLSRAFAVALLAAAGAALAAPPPELVWFALGAAGREGEVRVEGLPAERLARLGQGALAADRGQELLRVVAAPGGGDATAELPNLWGAYRIEAGALVFRPRHALSAGVTLVARFDGAAFDRATGDAGTPSRELRMPVADVDAPRARVVAVAPSGDEVPANLLRLYVEFSAPMSLADIECAVALVDAAGREIENAFVEIPHGLWDPERRRLTLIVHPGRIKRGVGANRELGPPLVEGERVTLVVRPEARNADGRPLAAPFERTFRIGSPQRAALDPATWELVAPGAASAPLAVRFDRPLDRALAERAFVVLDAEDAPVAGRFELAAGEMRAAFHPAAPWRSGGRYRLVVDPVLEDVAGNRLGLAFERGPGESIVPAAVELAFVVRLAPTPPAR